MATSMSETCITDLMDYDELPEEERYEHVPSPASCEG